jgi:hypothetical protein
MSICCLGASSIESLMFYKQYFVVLLTQKENDLLTLNMFLLQKYKK